MNTHHRRARIALTAAAAAAATMLTLTGCSSDTGDGAAGGNATLKVATIGLISDGSLQLGMKKGFFTDEGLEIETSIVANPPAGLAAAQSGQVDVAYSPSIPLLNALSQGIKLHVIQAADGYPDGSADASDPSKIDDTGLFASPSSGVTDVSQLGGKTIAIPARKAQLEVNITGALADAGVEPSSVKWVVLDFTSAVAALKSGTVDAAGLVSPFTTEAANNGSTLILSPGVAFFEQGAVGLWTAGESTVQNKAKEIAGFQRAIKKSNEYANAHPDEAIQAGIDYTKSTLTVDETTVPYWPTSVRADDLQRADDKLTQLGFLPTKVDLDGVLITEP